jgi:uncharacterized protein
VGSSDQGRSLNPRTRINCPRCKVLMTHLRDVDQRDVEYEYCVVCNGAFFDAGEFSQYRDASWLGTLERMFGKR